MNPQLLIDAIVRQTTVLIAQLSTAAGVRAPLSRIADQIFLDLAREIETQGVSRKVAADMFGLALRTYQSKVQRLAVSGTDRDRTLWEGIAEFIEETGPVERRKILARFERDDPLSVGAVLTDLLQSGLIEKSGSGAKTRFSVPSLAERKKAAALQNADAVVAIVWVAIYRGTQSAAGLVQGLGLERARVDAAIERLRSQNRVSGDDDALRTSGVVVPVGDERGWEAAVFDHYQAMVTAITHKLNQGARSRADDVVGGATVTFELDEDHPLRDEVRGLLSRVRGDVNDLWLRVREQNAERPLASSSKERVSFYFGQSTTEDRDE